MNAINATPPTSFTSSIIIAQNPQYEIKVSRAKNRAYLRIVGFWRSPEQVENYLADWKRALCALQRDFTLLTDAREMKIHPAAVRKLHEQAQLLLVNAGVRKVAELQKDAIAELQLDGISGETNMPKKNFNDPGEAEKWLDL